MDQTHQGMLLVISGPSGAGKGTLIKRLMEEDDQLSFSVSATTREARPGETHGEDYYFVGDEGFDKLLAQDAFVEWAHVHSGRYGTLHSEIERLNALGKDVVLDIDVQGALNVIRQYPECLSIFILPPSMEELHARLLNRATETPEQIELRMANAMREVALKDKYRYQVVNDDLEEAAAQLQAIIARERASR